ncbi:type II toxin-antitoxin system HicB family antitoxin [Helicobacter pylori]
MLINAVIEKDENGYFAFVPFLKGCVSQGKSYEEALRNIIARASQKAFQAFRTQTTLPNRSNLHR